MIGGFGTGDKIDLGSFAFSSATTRSFTEAPSHTCGTLSVINGASQAHLTLLGSYVTSNFALANDGTGGTLVKFADPTQRLDRSDEAAIRRKEKQGKANVMPHRYAGTIK